MKFKLLYPNPNIMTWWNSHSLQEKQTIRDHYLKVYEWNETINSHPFPMYDIKGLRLSQLSSKHIERMRNFKDYKI